MRGFVQPEEAMTLKRLGFDLPCFAYYKLGFKMASMLNGNMTGRALVFNSSSDLGADDCAAPTYQDALRWMEDKHALFIDRRVETSPNEILDIAYTIKSYMFPPVEIAFENQYDSFDRELADLACLRKLIEIAGQAKNAFQVVMLATEKVSNLVINQTELKFVDRLLSEELRREIIALGGNFQHLYITSDEPTKKGDWCLHQIQHEYYLSQAYEDNALLHYKIVATTDKSLRLPINKYLVRLEEADERDESFLLPQIPESFIPVYTKAYNEGSPITSVNLEIERRYLGSKCIKCDFVENHDEVNTDSCPKCSGSKYNHLYETIIKTLPDNTVVIL